MGGPPFVAVVVVGGALATKGLDGLLIAGISSLSVDRLFGGRPRFLFKEGMDRLSFGDEDDAADPTDDDKDTTGRVLGGDDVVLFPLLKVVEVVVSRGCGGNSRDFFLVGLPGPLLLMAMDGEEMGAAGDAAATDSGSGP